MSEDLLSSLLRSRELRGRMVHRSTAAAPWQLSVRTEGRLILHVVESGSCCCVSELEGENLQLLPGDLLLAIPGVDHRMADTDRPSAPTDEVTLEEAEDGHRAEPIRALAGNGAETRFFSAEYRLGSEAARLVGDATPPLLHLPGASRTQGLESALSALRSECEFADVGSSTVLSALLDILLVELLRSWLDATGQGSGGWLGALRDPSLSKALTALHQAPERPWTVASLAAVAKLSRAAFARRFREGVGASPAAYLTRIRLRKAADLLRRTEAPLAEIATRVGYDSPFAFNRAFKKEHGVPPGRYRRVPSN